jgi:hypothetical protein
MERSQEFLQWNELETRKPGCKNEAADKILFKFWSFWNINLIFKFYLKNTVYIFTFQREKKTI